MRLKKLIKKEFKETIRDKGFVLALIFFPIVTMLVFGYTFQADINNVNTIVIDLDNSQHSREIITSVEESEYFKIINDTTDLNESLELLKKSKIRALFYIPEEFSNKIENATKAEIFLYLDSSDYIVYNTLRGASAEVTKDSLQDIVSLIVKN